MLGRIGASILSSLLAGWVDPIDPSQLSVSYSGEVLVERLSLSPDALKQFELPVEVRGGFLSRLRMVVPWKSLGSQATTISVDGVYLLAGPAQRDGFSAETEEKRIQNVKQKLLQLYELLQARDDGTSSTAAGGKDESFTSRTLAKVVANLHVHVGSVHVRYEDRESFKGRPFAAGVTLQRLDAFPCDEKGHRAKADWRVPRVEKQLQLTNAAVYWDSNTELLVWESPEELIRALSAGIYRDEGAAPAHHYLMHPLCGELRVVRDKSDAKCRELSFGISVERVAFAAEENQFKELAALLQSFVRYHRGISHRRFRPPLNTSPFDAERWWAFAVRSLLHSHRLGRRRHLRRSISRAVLLRKAYVRAFKEHEAIAVGWFGRSKQRDLKASLRARLDQLEGELDYRRILLFRAMARAYLRLEADEMAASKKLRPRSSSQSAPAVLELDDERWRRIAAEALAAPASAAQAPLVDDVPTRYHVSWTVGHGSLLLSSDHVGQEVGTSVTVMLINFNGFLVDASVSGSRAIDVYLRLHSLYGYDLHTPDTAYTQVISPLDPVSRRPLRDERKENPVPFFQVSVARHPESDFCDLALEIESQPLEVVWSSRLVAQLVRMFDPGSVSLLAIDVGGHIRSTAAAAPSHSADASRASQTLEDLAFALAAVPVVNFSVHVHAPKLIVPQDLTDAASRALFVDLGMLRLDTALTGEEMKLRSPGRASVAPTMADFYRTYQLRVSSVQVFFVDDAHGGDWDVIVPVELVDPFDFNFQVAKLLVPSEEVPALTVSGSLPSLDVRASSARIVSVLHILSPVIVNLLALFGQLRDDVRTLTERVTVSARTSDHDPPAAAAAVSPVEFKFLASVVRLVVLSDAKELLVASVTEIAAEFRRNAAGMRASVVLGSAIVSELAADAERHIFHANAPENDADSGDPLLRLDWVNEREDENPMLADHSLRASVGSFTVLVDKLSIVHFARALAESLVAPIITLARLYSDMPENNVAESNTNNVAESDSNNVAESDSSNVAESGVEGDSSTNDSSVLSTFLGLRLSVALRSDVGRVHVIACSGSEILAEADVCHTAVSAALLPTGTVRVSAALEQGFELNDMRSSAPQLIASIKDGVADAAAQVEVELALARADASQPLIDVSVAIHNARLLADLSFARDGLAFLNFFKTATLELIGQSTGSGKDVIGKDVVGKDVIGKDVAVVKKDVEVEEVENVVRLVLALENPSVMIPGDSAAVLAHPSRLSLTIERRSIVLDVKRTMFCVAPGDRDELGAFWDVAVGDIFRKNFDVRTEVTIGERESAGHVSVSAAVAEVDVQLAPEQVKMVIGIVVSNLEALHDTMEQVRALTSGSTAEDTVARSETRETRETRLDVRGTVAALAATLMFGAKSQPLALVETGMLELAGSVRGGASVSATVQAGASFFVLRDIRAVDRREGASDEIVAVGERGQAARGAGVEIEASAEQLSARVKASHVRVQPLPESVAAFLSGLLRFVGELNLTSEGDSSIEVIDVDLDVSDLAVCVPGWSRRMRLGPADPALAYRFYWPALRLMVQLESRPDLTRFSFTTQTKVEVSRCLLAASDDAVSGFDLSRPVASGFESVIQASYTHQGPSAPHVVSVTLDIGDASIDLNIRELEPVLAVKDDWVEAFSQVLDSISKTEESSPSIETPPEDSTPSKDSSPSKYSTPSNDSSKDSNPSTPSVSGESSRFVWLLSSTSIDARIHSFRGAPLLWGKAKKTQVEGGYEVATGVARTLVDTQLSGLYYNVPLAAWDELCSPCQVSVQFDSRDGEASIVATSTERIGLTLGVELARSVALAFSPPETLKVLKVPTIRGYFATTEFSDVLLRNHTGINFYYLIHERRRRSAGGEQKEDEVRMLADGESRAVVGEAGGGIHDISALQNLQLSVWPEAPLSPLQRVDLDGLVGLRGYSLVQSALDRKTTAVLDTYVESGRRVLELRSPVELRNRCASAGVRFVFDVPGLDDSPPLVVPAAQAAHAPMHLLSGRLLISPDDDRWETGRHVTMAGVGPTTAAGTLGGGGPLALDRLTTRSELHACSWKKKRGIPPFVFLVCVDHRIDRGEVYHPPSNVVLHTVSVRAPLRVANLLPVAVEYRLEYLTRGLAGGDAAGEQSARYNKLTCGAVASGERGEIYVLNPLRGCSILRVKLGGFGWSTAQIVELGQMGEAVKSLVFEEEGGARKLSLQLAMRADQFGTLECALFSNYWIVNRTRLPLLVKQAMSAEPLVGQRGVEAEMEQHWGHAALDKRVDPRMWYALDEARRAALEATVLYSHVRGKGNMSVRLGTSEWSSGLVIRKNTSVMQVEVKEAVENGYLFELGMSIAPAPDPFWRTKTITFAPYRVMINRTARHVLYRQYTTDHDGYSLEPGEALPLYWSDSNAPRSLELRFADDSDPRLPRTLWSPPVTVEMGTLTVLAARRCDSDVDFLLRVETKLDVATLFVVLSVDDPDQPAWTVRNDSNTDVLVRQKGSSYDCLLVPAGQCRPFGLDVPDAKPTLLVSDTFDSYEVSLAVDGPVKTNDKGKVSMMVATYGPTKELRVSERLREEETVAAGARSLRILLSAPSIGISVVDNRRTERIPLPREIVYVTLGAPSVRVLWTPDAIKGAAGLMDVQVDNQMVDAAFEVAVVPEPQDEAVAVRSEAMPVIEFTFGVSTYSAKLVHLDYVALAVGQMDVRLDGVVASQLLDMAEFVEAQTDVLVYGVKQYLEVVRGVLLKHQHEATGETSLKRSVELFDVPQSVVEDMLLLSYEMLRVNPIQFYLTFEYRAGSDFLKLRQFESFAGNLLNFDRANIRVTGLSLQRQCETLPDLLRVLRTHYARQVQMQLATMFGHWDAIGSPVGLASNLSTGVVDFFSEPLKHGSLSEGLARGTSSLVENSVGGLLGSSTKVASALSSGFASLSMDADYMQQRQLSRRNKPRDLSEGVSQGMRDLSTGVFTGVAGVFTQPVIGASQDGMSGLARGVGRGVVGLGAKPLAGVMDLMSSTIGGMKTTTEFTKGRDRVRPPRFIHPDGVLRPYSPDAAAGWALLYRLDDPALAALGYHAHVPLGRSPRRGVLIFTSTHSMLVGAAGADPRTPQWVASWQVFRSVEISGPNVVFNMSINGNAQKRSAICDSNDFACTVFSKISSIILHVGVS